MRFDPTKPAFGSPDSSAEMRDQLDALDDKIDATPAGPQGRRGFATHLLRLERKSGL